MTKHEYDAYVERVEHYLKGCEAVSTGPCPGCEECKSNQGIKEHDPDDCGCNYLGNNAWDCGHIDGEEVEMHEEPWFSWSPCEICHSRLGGNRESWHCLIDGKIVHGTCCEDCAYFLNYGRLDDTTMWEVEHDGNSPPGDPGGYCKYGPEYR